MRCLRVTGHVAQRLRMCHDTDEMPTRGVQDRSSVQASLHQCTLDALMSSRVFVCSCSPRIHEAHRFVCDIIGFQ